MASAPPSTSTVSSNFDIVETSMEDNMKILSNLHELMLSKEMKNLPTKSCELLHLENMPKNNVLKLASREQRGLLTKQADRIKKRIYRDVGRMFFVYVPLIQKTSFGVLTLKLQNTDTGEVSDVITDAPANEAFVLMDRWGRSLVEKGDLQLLYSVICSDLRPEARVGEMMVFWDEHMSTHQTYSERGNPIYFPIMETKPQQYLRDKKMLLSLVRSRIAAGANSGGDIAPSELEVKALGGDRKVLRIKPRDSQDIQIEEYKEREIRENAGDVHLEEQPIPAVPITERTSSTLG